MAALDFLTGTFSRLRSAPLFRVVSVYILASWAVLQAIDLLTAQFGLPGWFFQAGLGLLLLGLPIVIGAAIIQTRTAARGGEPAKASADARRRAPRWLTMRVAVLGGVLAFIGLGSLGVGVIWLRNRGRELQPDVVSVLPFHVVGAGVELWREGLVDLMSKALNATGQFRASDPRAVLNRWRREAGDSDELAEPELAGDVAGSLNAGRMILGSLIRTGPDEVLVSADLYSVRWLRREATASVEGREDEITSLVDRLTVDLLRSVWEGDDVPDVRVSAITTTSLPALRAYLEGEQAFRRSQFVEAQAAFAAAVEADSAFAIAHYRLALSHGWWSGIGGDLQRHLTAAARHTQGLPERDSLLIVANKIADVDGDLDAIRLFERLTRRYPDDLEAWYGLGDTYFHMGGQAGHQLDSSVEPFERALALDSTFAPALIHLIEFAYATNDTARGQSWTDHYLTLDSTSFYAQAFKLLTPLAFGSAEESAAAEQALDTIRTELHGWVSNRLREWGPSSNLPLHKKVELAYADPRHPNDERGLALWNLAIEYMRLGQVATAVELVEQALPLFSGGLDGQALYLLTNARELGITDESVDGLIDRLESRFSYPEDMPWMAVTAASEGRFADARIGVERLQSVADSFSAAGDTAMGRSMQGQVWTIRGRVAAVMDSADAAVAHLRRGLPMINGFWTWPRDLDRYWLANLIRDRGGEDEALRIYGSIYQNPWLEALGYFERAQLHERRGEAQQAAVYYVRFIDMWSDADPHLQPRVESARRALERLASETVSVDDTNP